ncbi:hypothetical protein [Evansella cellulosilytica]|uniref:Uncharacterized protein n=1 Tax=Evansella cellulosilytica (strain ATCC 21833 / DSM 2522 / FERM P-1141 / JCM 9156 / N-4) TaxID=649639 RepID=E6U096_EVAC2|nr:hypothetical protein [Evansella cellulosilytica]ADU30212.1 hypothetical protein Bcell_1950 [Evansella cellulosilytica DSM 2522]
MLEYLPLIILVIIGLIVIRIVGKILKIIIGVGLVLVIAYVLYTNYEAALQHLNVLF